MNDMHVACGRCGSGPVYFETCDVVDHTSALASECQNCGERYTIEPQGCPDCLATEGDR